MTSGYWAYVLSDLVDSDSVGLIRRFWISNSLPTDGQADGLCATIWQESSHRVLGLFSIWWWKASPKCFQGFIPHQAHIWNTLSLKWQGKSDCLVCAFPETPSLQFLTLLLASESNLWVFRLYLLDPIQGNEKKRMGLGTQSLK
jgi:hypothetical protein